jgi:hypothetical protein
MIIFPQQATGLARLSRIAAIALALTACLSASCNAVKQTESLDDQTEAIAQGTVTMEIAFADESHPNKELAVDCFEGSTVFSIMQTAESKGMLKFEHRQNLIAAPESIFIESIEGVSNDDGKYWTYRVNGELAKQGCGTMPVRPDDKLKWVYGQSAKELFVD